MATPPISIPLSEIIKMKWPSFLSYSPLFSQFMKFLGSHRWTFQEVALISIPSWGLPLRPGPWGCSLGYRWMSIWVFPKIVVPQNGWFIMENPIKMDDLGVPIFLETPIYCNTTDCGKNLCNCYRISINTTEPDHNRDWIYTLVSSCFNLFQSPFWLDPFTVPVYNSNPNPCQHVYIRTY